MIRKPSHICPAPARRVGWSFQPRTRTGAWIHERARVPTILGGAAVRAGQVRDGGRYDNESCRLSFVATAATYAFVAEIGLVETNGLNSIRRVRHSPSRRTNSNA